MSKPNLLAKITRPRLPDVFSRTRLFRLLDQRRPFTWITGPAGSGKTTLISSYLDARKLPCLWYQLDEGDGDLATFFYYLGLAAKTATRRTSRLLPFLTPEYLQGISTFTKRYFENLCSRLKPPFTIVFDNYHHIPAKSAFHDMIRDALSVIPDGIHVIISSRCAPPPALALFTAYQTMQTVEWSDLKFDRNEIKSLFKAGRQEKLNGQMMGQIESLTTGWAAGLILILKRLKTQDASFMAQDRLNPEEFFDYFASELFERAEVETQIFLLKTSFLPHIHPDVAAALTGNDHAGKVLAELSQNNFFTERRSHSYPVYQYHPLFRQFLQERAKKAFSPGEMQRLLHQAAEALEKLGQLEDAAELYRTSEMWDGLVRIILSSAGTLISQGRMGPIDTWLDSLPDSLLEQEPWLLYWKGACRMPFNLAESHNYFSRALNLFQKKDDAAGAFRSWSGAIESKVHEMGDTKRLARWVALVFDLMKRYEFPSPDIEDDVTARVFTAIPWVPSDPEFVKWRSRAMELIEKDTNQSLRFATAYYLFCHYMWMGEFATARSVLEVIRHLTKSDENISPFAFCTGRICEGWYILAAEGRQCCSVIEETLKKAEASGAHIWDRVILDFGTTASLCSGDVSRAKHLLEKMESGLETARPFDKFSYHLCSAWFFMLTNDIQQAFAHQSQAQKIEEQTGFLVNAAENHFAMAIILHALGKKKKALEHATALHSVARLMGSLLMEYKALLLDAFFAFEAGIEQNGRDRLGQAMALAREKGFALFQWWLPSMMTSLYTKALESNIEIEHVQSIIRKTNLVPADAPLHIEKWPWPIEIYTLGRFTIIKDDKPLAFSRKVQKKPLQLLKILAAAGGKEVREDRIADMLWPDAEGDAGHKALGINVVRLRKLLGTIDAVAVRDGRISLDHRFCWTDALTFEHILDQVHAAGRQSQASRAAHLLQRSLDIYKGPFLADDPDPWFVTYREKLRSRFLEGIGTYGASLEQSSAYAEAIRIYQRGLEVDDLAEPYYQRLITCYKKLGRSAEALSVYRRCRKTLAACGVEPSPETEALRASLQR